MPSRVLTLMLILVLVLAVPTGRPRDEARRRKVAQEARTDGSDGSRVASADPTPTSREPASGRVRPSRTRRTGQTVG